MGDSTIHLPSLQDEAISVREAAVSLLGRHVASNQALALRLFSTLARASTDTGTSVRKAAIKILWESCIRVPGFPRATGARLMRILAAKTGPHLRQQA